MQATLLSPQPIGGTSSPVLSVKRAPSAVRQPIPPSVVALPPAPTRILRQPASSAARISSPTPKVVVYIGLASFPASGRPAAAAISRMAVPSFKMPKEALCMANSGPCTRTVLRSPPKADKKASTVPSPPSAIGRQQISSAESTCRNALRIIRHTSMAVIVPLKESGAITIRFF